SGRPAHAAEHPIRAMAAAMACLRNFMTYLLDVPSLHAADLGLGRCRPAVVRLQLFLFHPLRMIQASTSIDTAKLIQTVGGSSSPNHSIICSPRPTQARLTHAAAIRPMNSRSPRVVAMGRKPLRRRVG